MTERSAVGTPYPRTVMPSIAFVTVSYGPDRERCGFLCRSIDVLARATADHLIVVDRADLPLFRDLESGLRRIVATEAVLPGRVWRLEARRLGLRSNIFCIAGSRLAAGSSSSSRSSPRVVTYRRT